MSDGSVQTNQFPTANGLAATDTVVVNVTQANGVTNTSQITIANMLANSRVNAIAIPITSTPANSTANGSVGTITWDSGYLYVCTSNNVWKRVALSSF